jgi:hypothetical protein
MQINGARRSFTRAQTLIDELHKHAPVWERSSCRSAACSASPWEIIPDLFLRGAPPCRYAIIYDTRHGRRLVACQRGLKRIVKRPLLESWLYPMALGQPLPTLPIWLEVDLGVFLDLKTSYEETCHVLRIA